MLDKLRDLIQRAQIFVLLAINCVVLTVQICLCFRTLKLCKLRVLNINYRSFSKSSQLVTTMSESIAVIGMSCRFPNGANDPEKYWELLASGTDAWSQVPTARWNEEAFYHPDAAMNGATNHRGGYFIDQNLDAFEPSFFGISGEEAKAMDPQQRIQLEIAYEALENAGIPKEALPESDTAVYVASFSRDYDRLMYKDISSIPKHHMVGTGDTILSNRISHIFDLRGPSMTIDTACSGSLVALHQACQSLRTCESSMTLVGASNLIISPDQLISMSLAR